MTSSLLSSLTLILTLTLTLTNTLTTTATAAAALDICIQHYTPPQVRYPPPPLAPSQPNTPPWTPPPPSHLWSPYHFTHSTRPRYLALANMQATHYPIFPQSPQWPINSHTDLISWSTSATDLSDDRITTVFGYFRPITLVANESVSAVWEYSSTGPLANTTNMWAILGWGVDSDGVEWRIDYESGYYVAGGAEGNGSPCINVASRTASGPSEVTYGQIVRGLVEAGERVGDAGFVALVGGLRPMRSDGRREGEGEISCDESCVMNVGLVPGR